jgi:hypothetical protein
MDEILLHIIDGPGMGLTLMVLGLFALIAILVGLGWAREDGYRRGQEEARRGDLQMTNFKMGRKRPVARPMRFSLNNYLRRSLPPTPPTCMDLIHPARESLKRVYLNDRLSCCTASAAFHIEYMMLASAGRPAVGSDEDVLKFYSGSTGYVPGRPETDQGGDEQTVLNYWREHGLVQGRAKIAGHIYVDGRHIEELKAAIWLFENVYFGIELPDAWISPQPQATASSGTSLAGPT